MCEISLVELLVMAQAARKDIWAKAAEAKREPMLYLHWSAGHYGSFFPDYHLNIDYDGGVYSSTMDLAEQKSHTWLRNSGAVGIALACCYQATTNDWGPEPPTVAQIESLARVTAVLCQGLALACTEDYVRTHAEQADYDGYGPATSCERWDLWFFPGVEPGEGGRILRGKAIYYLLNGVQA